MDDPRVENVVKNEVKIIEETETKTACVVVIDLDSVPSQNGTKQNVSIDSESDWALEIADDEMSSEEKKMAKRLLYKAKPFLDLYDDAAVRKFISDAECAYIATLDLVELTHTQKFSNDQTAAVLEVISPCLREKIPDIKMVDVPLRMQALEGFVKNRLITFELFDQFFAISSIPDKLLVGEFLIDQILQSSQCQQAERVLFMFPKMLTLNADQILTALLIVFWKFAGSARTLEAFRHRCDRTVYNNFIHELDRLLMNREDITVFMEKYELDFTKLKNFRDIKKFLNRMYKSVLKPNCVRVEDHDYFALTPNFIELANWETLLYLMKVRFKQGKSSMSNDAWLELSQLLVNTSPVLKSRLMNTLRNIGIEEQNQWAMRYSNLEDFEEFVKKNFRKSFVHVNLPMASSQTQNNFRFYNGKPNSKLTITFVDNEQDFDYMLDFLQKVNVIGLDGEWLPIFSYLPSRISILQISASNNCFILDLLNFHEKPASYKHCWNRFLKEVLENKRLIKIGFGIHNDIDSLKVATNVPSISIVSCMDLSSFTYQLISYFRECDIELLAHQRVFGVKRVFMHIVNRCRQPEHRQQGLSLLAYILLGKEMDKSEQMSNWNRRPLRQAQLVYSALDAYVLVDMYELLQTINTEIFKFDSVERLLMEVKMTPDSKEVFVTRKPTKRNNNRNCQEVMQSDEVNPFE